MKNLKENADGQKPAEMMRQQVPQRLDAAEEENSETLESRAADAEQQLSCLKENERQRHNLDAVLNPSDQLNVLVFSADVQTVLIKEESPEEWRPGVDQMDPEPLNIKEEEEEELSGMKEADPTRMSFTAAPLQMVSADVQTVLIKEETPEEWMSDVDQQDPEPLNIKEEEEELSGMKRADATRISLQNEEDMEKSLFSQLHHQQIEAGDLPTSSSSDQIKASTGEGAESTRNSDPNTYVDNSNSSETEVSENDEDDQDGNSSDSELKPLSKTEDCNKDGKKSRSSESDVNTVNKSFSCSECGKQFLHKRSLQRHETSHSGISLDNKKCVGVKENVKSSKEVQTRQTSYSCDYCGKRFNMKSNLNSHMRIHTGERPFACDFCGQKFSQKPHLKTHTRIHTGEKPFVCDVCGQTFSRKTHLERHMRIHTGQKPYACDVCGQTFSQKTSLNTHTRIHTGQKPFSCEICGQKFSQKTKLNTHTRIHTGQKPFACDICGRRFSDKRNLNTHMRIHTGQKPFACNYCGQRFSIKTNLNRHIRIHTGSKALI